MYTDVIPDLQRLYYYVAVFEISLTFISGIVIVFMAVMLRKSFKQLSLRRTKDAYEPLIGELEPLNGEYEYDRDINIGVQSGIKMESTVENNTEQNDILHI